MDALHMFGCGVNKYDFNTKFNALDHDKQQRLERVARRLWVILKLKYNIRVFENPFESPDEHFTLTQDELPAMSIYLLVTCLDTLAGKAQQHIDFSTWLKKQSITQNLNIQEINDLFIQYTEEYGVGKNLRMRFDNLPSCTKEWLAQNVDIREVGHEISVEPQDPILLVRRLYNYFYKIRRNKYTHSSLPIQVSTSDDIKDPDGTDWWVTPASGVHIPLDGQNPNKLGVFSYRQGLDEATILHLIIHSVALQILNIEITKEIIDLNLRNFSRIDGLYAFIGEIVRNANNLKFWSNIPELDENEVKIYLIYRALPVLRNQAASRMLDRFNGEEEARYHQLTLQYLRKVDDLNTLITNFNEKNPCIEPMQNNSEAHWKAIKAFLNDVSSTQSAHWLRTLPTTAEAMHLWFIIRDPCSI